MNMTLFKPCGGRAKNEICCAFNIASVEILPGSGFAGKENVLVADEATIYKRCFITCDLNGHGLSGSKPCIILESNVSGGEMISTHKKTLRSVGLDGITIW